MKIIKQIKSLGSAVFGAIASVSATDSSYQFIVSGYPAKNESKSFCTAGTALNSGTYRYVLAETSLEAHYRSRYATLGTALNSEEYRSIIIIIK